MTEKTTARVVAKAEAVLERPLTEMEIALVQYTVSQFVNGLLDIN